MQYKKAQGLQKAWGNKPCDHPEFDKEYMLGMNTGDLVCTQCGRSFDPESVKSLREKQEIKNSHSQDK